MHGNWKFISEDAQTISLHDHWISLIDENGADLVLHFAADGFDVTRDNALNPTGRHRNTGRAAVILQNWRWVEGVFNRGVTEIKPGGVRYALPETPLPCEMFLHHLEDLEIYDHAWNAETGQLILAGDWYTDENQSEFCTITLGCNRLFFCWNALPHDAWFQDWPRK